MFGLILKTFFFFLCNDSENLLKYIFLDICENGEIYINDT